MLTEVAPFVLAIMCGVSRHYALAAQQQVLGVVAPCLLTKYVLNSLKRAFE